MWKTKAIKFTFCVLNCDYKRLTANCFSEFCHKYLRTEEHSPCIECIHMFILFILRICLDANCIEEAPCFSSTRLRLYTAPGNKFPDIPLAPHFDRLEVHGNQIRTADMKHFFPTWQAEWDDKCFYSGCNFKSPGILFRWTGALFPTWLPWRCRLPPADQGNMRPFMTSPFLFSCFMSR